MDVVHVLNGDALRQRFPDNISGEIIVARECLIDGDVTGDSFDQLMENRANFIASYPGCTAKDYLNKSKTEFDKIRFLSEDAHIVLWFEEDLFCQVNLWFVCTLLVVKKKINCRLVRPNEGNEYSFAHMTNEELNQAYSTAQVLSHDELLFFRDCWLAYQIQNDTFLSTARVPKSLSFVKAALAAELDRRPDDSGYGKPEREIKRIVEALVSQQQEVTFKAVFSEFYKTMGIYSFGDIQVKRLYEELTL